MISSRLLPCCWTSWVVLWYGTRTTEQPQENCWDIHSSNAPPPPPPSPSSLGAGLNCRGHELCHVIFHNHGTSIVVLYCVCTCTCECMCDCTCTVCVNWCDVCTHVYCGLCHLSLPISSTGNLLSVYIQCIYEPCGVTLVTLCVYTWSVWVLYSSQQWMMYILILMLYVHGVGNVTALQ